MTMMWPKTHAAWFAPGNASRQVGVVDVFDEALGKVTHQIVQGAFLVEHGSEMLKGRMKNEK